MYAYGLDLPSRKSETTDKVFYFVDIELSNGTKYHFASDALNDYAGGIDYRYDARIKTFPIVKSKSYDILFGGKSLNSVEVEFYNKDGYFDNFTSADLYNAWIWIRLSTPTAITNYLGHDSISKYTIFYGVVTNFSFDNDSAKIEATDPISKLRESKVATAFDSETLGSGYTVGEAATNLIKATYGNIFSTYPGSSVATHEYKFNVGDDYSTLIERITNTGRMVLTLSKTIGSSSQSLSSMSYSASYGTTALPDPTGAYPDYFLIRNEDMLEVMKMDYDTSKLVSSITVNYGNINYGTQYSYRETSLESSIFSRFGVKRDVSISTMHYDQATASAYAIGLLNYYGAPFVTAELTLPFFYIYLFGKLSEPVWVEFGRANGVLTAKKCNVLDVSIDANSLTIKVKVRVYETTLSIRVDTDGNYRITTDNYIRGVIA